MTISSIVENALALIGPETIGADLHPYVFSSGLREHRDLANIINRSALDIARSHDWQSLKKVATFTGDGSATAFDLPSDYDRRVHDAQLWVSDIQRHYEFVEQVDDWLRFQTQFTGSTLDLWTIYADQVQTLQAMSNGTTAKFFYLTNEVAKSSGGTPSKTFSADTDVFQLDDNLLELAIVWRWKQLKKQDFSADKAMYDREITRLIARDKGPSVIRVGAKRTIRGARVSDPWRFT